MNLLAEIYKSKIIAIVRGVPTAAMEQTARALLAGGVRMLEITFNHESEAGLAETLDSIRELHTKLPDEILLGAGTVLSPDQVQLAYDNGARYIISPNVDVDVIRKTKELGMISIPGAFTPTETVVAYNAGADVVKLFPAGLLGTAYIKAVKAPLAHIPVAAVGGVDEHNIAEFFAAGVVCVGIGGNLVNNKLVAQGNFAKITQTAQRLVEALA